MSCCQMIGKSDYKAHFFINGLQTQSLFVTCIQFVLEGKEWIEIEQDSFFTWEERVKRNLTPSHSPFAQNRQN